MKLATGNVQMHIQTARGQVVSDLLCIWRVIKGADDGLERQQMISSTFVLIGMDQDCVERVTVQLARLWFQY